MKTIVIGEGCTLTACEQTCENIAWVVHTLWERKNERWRRADWDWEDWEEESSRIWDVLGI